METGDWRLEIGDWIDVLMLIQGRCSHVCNAGFLTTEAARGKGVGVAMGETYLEFAPKLVSLPPIYSGECRIVTVLTR